MGKNGISSKNTPFTKGRKKKKEMKKKVKLPLFSLCDSQRRTKTEAANYWGKTHNLKHEARVKLATQRAVFLATAATGATPWVSSNSSSQMINFSVVYLLIGIQNDAFFSNVYSNQYLRCLCVVGFFSYFVFLWLGVGDCDYLLRFVCATMIMGLNSYEQFRVLGIS